jgi:hypothetical protein
VSILLTPTGIVSDATVHAARLSDEGWGEGWEVTWLPGHVLSRNQAFTAVAIAELAAATPQHARDDPAATFWTLLNDWAIEVCLTLTSEAMHYLFTGTVPSPSVSAAGASSQPE